MLKSRPYDLLEWSVLAVALSYFLMPYYPKQSLEILGKTFFLSQILMLFCAVLLAWFIFASLELRARVRFLFKLRSVLWPLLLCFAIIVVSTLLAHGLTVVIVGRIFSVAAVILIFFLFALLSQKFIDRLLILSAFVTIAASILGYFQYFGGQVFAPAFHLYGRGEIFAVGFATHSSDFGLHLGAFLTIFWLLFLFDYRQKSMLWGLAFFSGVPALILTFSRAAWLATVLVGVMVLAWLLREHSDKLRRIFSSLALAAVMSLIVFVLAFYFSPLRSPSSAFDRMYKPTLASQKLALNDESSLSRIAFHLAAFELLLDSPKNLAIGYGMWGFWDNWPRFDPEQKIKDHIDPHSTFLEVVVSGGVLAFLFFLMFLWRFFKLGYQNRHQHILAMPLMAAFATIMVDSLMHTHLYTKYTWIIAGLALALIASSYNNAYSSASRIEKI